ncbi:hypothetical protein [Hymenobacter sp. YC55]|uniref:hypothetical protein n=1 Tax=Hymenobacter sp. YC55 TaxID=3034019 RepID=UPI0023F7A046|nr:hypothetical protein [Hymenobacter sp. YC55]MDF7815752.1 hypothetical protein [Hymenobacter sp. YC55]
MKVGALGSFHHQSGAADRAASETAARHHVDTERGRAVSYATATAPGRTDRNGPAATKSAPNRGGKGGSVEAN